MARQWRNVILVLSGGNALGAFQAGAYEALHAAGLMPDHVAGSSTGAVNAALIAGNPPPERLGALTRFWLDIAREPGLPSATIAPMAARTWGRPGIFAPALPRLTEIPVGQPALYDLTPLRGTLESLCNLDDLTARITVNATDISSGEAVVFDSTAQAVTLDPVVASCALLPDFAPMEVDGRILGDGGLSANLPLSAAMADLPQDDTLVVAVDLFDPRGEAPRTVIQAAGRRMDLALSSQARLEVERLKLRREAAGKNGGRLLVLHLVRDNACEAVTDKAYDFSAEALRRRWDDGRSRLAAALADLPSPAGCGRVTVLERR